MKIKDITEPGFYMTYDPCIMYEVFENTDKKWLEEEPDAKLIVDEWVRDTDGLDLSLDWYQSSGCLFSLYYDLAEIDVFKTCVHYELYGHGGTFLKAVPPIIAFYEL